MEIKENIGCCGYDWEYTCCILRFVNIDNIETNNKSCQCVSANGSIDVIELNWGHNCLLYCH